jgi:hypothetical protein
MFFDLKIEHDTLMQVRDLESLQQKSRKFCELFAFSCLYIPYIFHFAIYFIPFDFRPPLIIMAGNTTGFPDIR